MRMTCMVMGDACMHAWQGHMISQDEILRKLQEADKEHDHIITKYMQNLVSGTYCVAILRS